MKVEVVNLGMQYANEAQAYSVFSGVNFSLDSGKSLALVGKSGVGKTTLLNLITGLEQPTSGEVILGDTSLKKLYRSPESISSFRGKNIGIVLQFNNLIGEFSALENVAMPLLIAGIGKSEALDRSRVVLKSVGLEGKEGLRPARLSGGQQQRVAIARALVPNPGLIVFDEPTGNLDPNTSFEIAALLRDVQDRGAVTILAVTHSYQFAKQLDFQKELTPEGLVDFVS